MTLNLPFSKCLLVLCMMAASAGTAAEKTVVELTLPLVERMALEQNPSVKAAQAIAGGASYDSLKALAPYDPMIMLGFAGQPDSPLALDQAATRTLMWDQRWRFPGKSLVDLGGISASTRMKQAMEKNARRSALVHARLSYWHLVEQQKIYELRSGAVGQWKKFNDLLVSRGLAGQWLSLKLIKAQMGLARESNDFITAKEELEVAKSHLRHILGQENSVDYRLGKVASLPAYRDPAAGHLDHGHDNHPLVLVAAEKLSAAQSARAAARAAFLPDLSTRLWMDDRRNGADSYGFRVGFQVPLGLSQASGLSEASGRVEAAKQELKETQDLVHHRLEEARVNARAAFNLVNLYEKGGLIKQAEQGWEFARTAWRNDGLTLVDYIESYDAYLDIQTAYIKARANYGRALARLDFERGILEVKE